MIRFEITAVDTVETLTDLAQLGRYAEKCLAAMKSTAQHPEEPYAVPAAGDAGLPSAPTDHAATSATAPAQEQSAPPAAETREKPPRPEEVREKSLAAARKHGKDAVKSILKKFNVENMSSLSWEDVGKVLARISDLTKWAEQVQAYAQSAAITHGQVIPGWKLVQGRSNRKYADEPAIAAALRKAGYKAGEIYKPKALLGLTAMEKLVGAKKLNQLAGQYIIKPEGAPVLVPESDKRPAINTAAQAAEDFKEDLT